MGFSAVLDAPEGTRGLVRIPASGKVTVNGGDVQLSEVGEFWLDGGGHFEILTEP